MLFIAEKPTHIREGSRICHTDRYGMSMMERKLWYKLMEWRPSQKYVSIRGRIVRRTGCNIAQNIEPRVALRIPWMGCSLGKDRSYGYFSSIKQEL